MTYLDLKLQTCGYFEYLIVIAESEEETVFRNPQSRLYLHFDSPVFVQLYVNFSLIYLHTSLIYNYFYYTYKGRNTTMIYLLFCN